jgi:hypothetical protein
MLSGAVAVMRRIAVDAHMRAGGSLAKPSGRSDIDRRVEEQLRCTYLLRNHIPSNHGFWLRKSGV